jgi:hypothetical protein
MGQVVLVAFELNEGANVEDLFSELPRPMEGAVESWWQADEDRIDGSDNDSAVFVRPGYGRAASTLLFEAGMTGSYNIVNPSPIWEGPGT